MLDLKRGNMKKENEINNPSRTFNDAIINAATLPIVEQGHLSGRNDVCVLLYGNYVKQTTETLNLNAQLTELDYFAFDKYLEFRGDSSIDNTDLLMQVSINEIKLMMGAQKISFRGRRGRTYGNLETQGAMISDFRNQIIHNVEGARYYVFKADFPVLADVAMNHNSNHVGMHLLQGSMRQRNLHYCNDCSSHYRNFCRCISHHRMESRPAADAVIFYDVQGDKVHTKDISMNAGKKATERKAFIGCEFEISNDKQSKSRNEQNLQLVRWAKRSVGVHFAKLLNNFTTDGTLTNGVEIITQPFSSDYFDKFRTAFESLSNQFAKQGMAGHRSNNYGDSIGMHIHISKDAFTRLHLQRFLKLNYQSVEQLRLLSNRGNRCYGASQISSQSFSGRRSSGRANPTRNTAKALGFDKSEAGYLSDKEIKALAADIFNGGSVGSRSWWNHSNYKTMEYRLPAMVTDKAVKGKDGAQFNLMVSQIELMFAMYDFTRKANFKDCTFKNFVLWLKKSKYKNILGAIQENDAVLVATFGKGKILSGEVKVSGLDEAAESMQTLKSQLLDDDIDFTLSNLGQLRDMINAGADAMDDVFKNPALDEIAIEKEVSDFKSKGKAKHKKNKNKNESEVQ